MPFPIAAVAQVAVYAGAGAAGLVGAGFDPRVITWNKFAETLNLTVSNYPHPRATGVIDGFAVSALPKGHLGVRRAKEYYLNVNYPLLAQDIHVRRRDAGPLTRFEFERTATYSDGFVDGFDTNFVACGSDPFEATSFFTQERREALMSISEVLTYVSETEMTCNIPGKLRPVELAELVARITGVAAVLVGADKPRMVPVDFSTPPPEPATPLPVVSPSSSPFSRLLGNTESSTNPERDMWVLASEMLPGLEPVDGVGGLTGWVDGFWVSVEVADSPGADRLFRYRIGYQALPVEFSVVTKASGASLTASGLQAGLPLVTTGDRKFDRDFEVRAQSKFAVTPWLNATVRGALLEVGRYAWHLEIGPTELAQTAAEVDGPWHVAHTVRQMITTAKILQNATNHWTP